VPDSSSIRGTPAVSGTVSSPSRSYGIVTWAYVISPVFFAFRIRVDTRRYSFSPSVLVSSGRNSSPPPVNMGLSYVRVSFSSLFFSAGDVSSPDRVSSTCSFLSSDGNFSANAGMKKDTHKRTASIPKNPNIFLTGSRIFRLPSFFILMFIVPFFSLLFYVKIPESKESDKQTGYCKLWSSRISRFRGSEICPAFLVDVPLSAA